jgi:hypothetical protein
LAPDSGRPLRFLRAQGACRFAPDGARSRTGRRGRRRLAQGRALLPVRRRADLFRVRARFQFQFRNDLRVGCGAICTPGEQTLDARFL